MSAHKESASGAPRTRPAPNIGFEKRAETIDTVNGSSPERTLFDLFALFMNVPADQITDRIEQGLAVVASRLGMNRVGLYALGPAQGEISPVLVCPDNGAATGLKAPWLYRRLQGGDIVVATQPSELPQEAAAERDFMRAGPLDLFARVPISGGGRVTHCLGLDRLGTQVKQGPGLPSTVKTIAALFGDLLERRRLYGALRDLSHNDQLTGLANRTLLNDRLRIALARARRRQRCLAVVFLNLDRFKTINDSLGYRAGDALLREVASRLVKCVREDDSVARIGGDEFVVVLEDIDNEALASHTAARISAMLAQPFVLEGQQVFIAASQGMAAYGPKSSEDADTLVRNANTAMTWAKKGGGNQSIFHAPKMNLQSRRRLMLESRLRQALPNGELEVHFQPEFDLQAGRIMGAEALIRWNDPSRGLVSPADFLPIAEETGLIQPISEWIVAEACRACREWQSVRPEGLKVAVNASGSWLLQASMAGTVKRTLEDTGLNPEHLEIEITEDIILGDAKASSAALGRLKDLGVSIALDDFGTGYSSLSHLQKFPVDAIKIDRSFVSNITQVAGDATIVKTLVALGNNLSLRVIAEGVETADQMEFLRVEQCRLAQGYLIGRPQPHATFMELLKSSAAQG